MKRLFTVVFVLFFVVSAFAGGNVDLPTRHHARFTVPQEFVLPVSGDDLIIEAGTDTTGDDSTDVVPTVPDTLNDLAPVNGWVDKGAQVLIIEFEDLSGRGFTGMVKVALYPKTSDPVPSYPDSTYLTGRYNSLLHSSVDFYNGYATYAFPLSKCKEGGNNLVYVIINDEKHPDYRLNESDYSNNACSYSFLGKGSFNGEDNPLPVELVVFEVQRESNGDVEITWVTESETNNLGFGVERKIGESGYWVQLDFVAGNGTTTIRHQYKYTDETAYQAGTYYYRLRQKDTDGTFNMSQEKVLLVKPNDYKLGQNYPNPFNPTTNIEFSIPDEAHVKLIVFNTIGQVVAELVNEELSAETYVARFNAVDLSTGVYFYRIQAGEFTQTNRMMLVK